MLLSYLDCYGSFVASMLGCGGCKVYAPQAQRLDKGELARLYTLV